jgi:hypothetical protein
MQKFTEKDVKGVFTSSKKCNQILMLYFVLHFNEQLSKMKAEEKGKQSVVEGRQLWC